MQETSLSLLDRLRTSPENEGWNRLADLYAPLIRVWLRRYDVQNSDAQDLIQEVLLSVSRDRHPQAHGDSDIDARLAQLDDPTSELSHIWNLEHDQYVLRQLLALAEPHFEPTTWKAFCRVALEGETAEAVAREMGISKNAVIVAKCRVLNKLRQEAGGLIDSSAPIFPKS
ncbi:MAG: sigma-70 family RNA polymerase sigma factor [Pirellula sp.]|nr:sigma-70 family RNA polymerase sigma factor [Pirellula sp.]